MSTQKKKQRGIDTLTYLKNLLIDPNIASITPTSSWGIKKTLKGADFKHSDVIVEYGPGTGVFTKYVLKRLNPKGKFIAFETNEDFAEIVENNINDTRFQLFIRSAEDVKKTLKEHKIKEVDFVISGIPFSMMDKKVGKKIVKDTYDILKPGGRFLVYQFLKPEKKADKGIHLYLPEYFDDVSRFIELRNIPPLVVYWGHKK